MFSLFPSFPPTLPIDSFFQIHGLYFFNYCYLKIQIQPVLSIKCYLYVFDFRADHCVLKSQLKGSSLGKTISPSFIIPLLPIILYLWLRSHEISPYHASMSIYIFFLLRSPLGSYVDEISQGSFSDISRLCDLTENFVVLWFLQSSCSIPSATMNSDLETQELHWRGLGWS